MPPAALVALFIVLLVVRPAIGQATQPGSDAGEPIPAIEVSATVGVWTPRLGGTVSLDRRRSFNFETGVDLDDLEPMFNGEISVKKLDEWELLLGGFDFSTSVRGRTSESVLFGRLRLAAGDRYHSSFDMTSFNIEVNLAVLRPYAPPADATRRRPVDLRITPQFGARYVDVEHVVGRVGGRRVSGGGEWLAALIGVQLDLRFDTADQVSWLHRLHLEAAFAAGPAFGGDGGTMYQVRGGLRFEFTPNIGVLIGYRLVELDVESDGYVLDGGLQGVFVSGSIRF